MLIFHGSKNPNYLSSLLSLAASIRAILKDQHLATSDFNSCVSLSTQEIGEWRDRFAVPLIEIAVLECGDLPLSKSIVNFAQQAIIGNYQRLILIPVFLSAGVHVLEDIPRELSQAKRALGSTIDLELTDYVGNFPQMEYLIASRLKKFGSAGKILLAHGSRMVKGNVAIENLAKTLGVSNAYWIIEPDLFQVVEFLIAQGKTSIAILPYFLFIGKITDIISSQVLEMQKEFPLHKFCLDRPLGESEELAFVIAAQIKKYL